MIIKPYLIKAGSGIGNSFGILFILFWLLLILPVKVFSEETEAEEYKFDASETEKKPYHFGGYLEAMPILFGLDRNASLYKLNYYNRGIGWTTPEYAGTLQLEGGLEKGLARFYFKSNTTYTKNYAGEKNNSLLFEGYASLKPSPTFIAEVGKKTLNWGKGYAWNPAAFLDRQKNPDDPELAREGFVVATLDYTKSWEGQALKTFSFTPVIMPVYSGINDEFGSTGLMNFASKFYFLWYDTDIDFMFLTGGSKPSSYGLDFSRNISTNLEVHGEFSLINNFTKMTVDSNGMVTPNTYHAVNALLGLRYLTAQDTTYILEVYRNGQGYSSREMTDFFSFIDKGYTQYTQTGNTSQLNKAANLLQGAYGKMTPETQYFYFRVSQKEPFDILYFTPAVTVIANLEDKSFSLTPEFLYTGITNLELRLRTGLIFGSRDSEFGEKQNDYRIDFRVRYYF
ncbi:MAG: hypothetical protein L7F78_05820 [Syntrophales bacterium LBB04]|nr:hypothetical protein [Syntrophales bacterium LBB04]